MAWLFGDTFDHYTTLSTKWTTVGSGSQQTIVAGAGRNSTSGLRFTGGNGRVGIGVAPGSTTAIFQFPMRFGALASCCIATVDDGVSFGHNHVTFTVNANGSISATKNDFNQAVLQAGGAFSSFLGSTAAGLLHAGVYHTLKFKVKVDASAGEVEIWIDGALRFTFAGNTKNANGAANWTQVYIGTGSGGLGNVDVDYFALVDDTTADNADLPSDLDGECVFVTGAGSNTDWTPNTGTNASCVDDAVPDNATTKVSSDVPGDTDTYAHGALTRVATGIVCVQIVTVAEKDSGDTRALEHVARVGGVDYPGGVDHYLPTDWAMQVTPYANNPATGLPWTEAQVNAAEIGQKVSV